MTILRLIQIACGVILLIASFTARCRRESPRWILLIMFLGGLLAVVYGGSGPYFDSLRDAKDPAYERFLPTRSFLGGICVGFLACMLLHHLSTRNAKNEIA